MDPRVCAASHRSLLRPRMTKAQGLTANRKCWRLAAEGRPATSVDNPFQAQSKNQILCAGN